MAAPLVLKCACQPLADAGWKVTCAACGSKTSEARTSDRPGGEPPASGSAVAAPPAAPRSGGAS